jgi:hypothetical protein
LGKLKGLRILAIIELYGKESTFARANRIAEERKARAWAAYDPLPREAFVDDWLNTHVTIAVIGDTGTRSTFGKPQKRSTGDTVMRPTELTATAQAYAATGQGQEDIVVIRLDPFEGMEVRKCGYCQKTLSIKLFDRAKKNISGVDYLNGISFYCTECRRKLRRLRAA